MLQKNKTPWGALVFVLLLFEVMAYYLSGMCILQDVTILNWQEKLGEILTHPFYNYFNPKTPAFLALALILWIMAVSYFLTYYRDFHFATEQGTAEWGDLKKISKKMRAPDGNTYLSHNIAYGPEALSNMNFLIIGNSGAYKSTSVVGVNILKALFTNVILDIKGDFLRKYGNYLLSKGVAVKVLNFKKPLESDRYNPFRYVYSDADLVSLITLIQESVKRPDEFRGDPFWDDGVGLYLQAIFYYEWLEAQEQGRKATMNNILKLVNWETQKIDEDGTTKLKQAMDALERIYGKDYPPVRDYRKLKEGATETVRSIIIMVNAQFRLFELPEIKRIFSDDDIDIPSLGLGIDGNPQKKTALFLVLPSQDNSYNLFINIFYAQLFRVLCNIADNECPGGALPIHVRLFADEFYSGPKPQNCESLMGEIRARNLSIVPALQDIAQMKALFRDEKWEIFTGNCAAMIYLGSGPTAHTTHQWISDLCSKATIESRTEHISSGTHGNNSLQTSRAGVQLITPDAVQRLDPEKCIIFLEKENPVIDDKNLPWKYKIPEWIEAKKMPKYTHPVRVVYNPKTREYQTIITKSKIQFLTPQELRFYAEAEKSDPSIKIFNIDETDFLYLNWNVDPKPSMEELEEIFRFARKTEQEISEMEIPDDVPKFGTSETEQTDIPKNDTWDLSGTIMDCLERYALSLTNEEIDEIVKGIEDGLTDRQIKSYFALHDAGRMSQYRRAYKSANM